MQLKAGKCLLNFGVSTILLCGLAMADSITLRDGRHVQGKFAGGTQGVVAFSVGGATQYYEVSNILVMTFEPEGSDSQGASHQQTSPAIVPESGSILRQHHQLHGNSDAKKRVVRSSRPLGDGSRTQSVTKSLLN
jgi:hypothetical protein